MKIKHKDIFWYYVEHRFHQERAQPAERRDQKVLLEDLERIRY
jgi:hypothetical protein